VVLSKTIVVLSKTTDPRTGETTTEIRDLDRGQLDPALFQIPTDYKGMPSSENQNSSENRN
jgi:hypothetical protein